MSVAHIDIGTDFSPYLGPRYQKDGQCSGEKFRVEILEKSFLANETVVIHLDSLEGYTVSFFEEAFGGLVRQYGYERVAQSIQFVSIKREYLIEHIKRWMREA